MTSNEDCHQIYSHTVELAVGDVNRIIAYLFPVLYCAKHQVYSYLVGYDRYNKRHHRGPLYIHDEDLVINPLTFFTLHPFTTTKVK